MYANWIAEFNLIAWLDVLSSIAGYDFDPWDRDAFEAGVANSDGEQNRWFEYKLAGRTTLDVKVAKDVGTEVILVQFDCPPDLEPKVDTATEIARKLRLIGHRRFSQLAT